MVQGVQAEVATPGNNVKRHLAGSLHWRTGTLLVSPPGTRRETKLFLGHPNDLRQLAESPEDPRDLRQRRLPRLAPVQEYLYRWRTALRCISCRITPPR